MTVPALTGDSTGDQSGRAENSPSHVVWRLAAFAFADIAGYSRLMAADGVRTVQLWNRIRNDVLLPALQHHRGRLLETPGDAVLVEFPSLVGAVQWAIDVQQALSEQDSQQDAGGGDDAPMLLRIAVNLDDVIDDEGHPRSDGINIASRIQQFANPGQIVATAVARELIGNRLPVFFRDLGTPALKNMDRPVRVFAIERQTEPKQVEQPYLSWTNRPTLAVLPFRNMAGTEDETYFGEGITEDIIAGVSRSRSFFVIARSSTLQFGDHSQNPQAVAAALGVKYVLTGSVRRQAERLRINVELVEVDRLHTIWAERFDGGSQDLFEFQDRIVSNIVARIEPQVRGAETARIGARPTASLDAYDCVLRALSHLYHFRPEYYSEARTLLERAVTLDPSYAQAHAYLAWCLNFWIGEGHSRDPDADRRIAVESARRAVELDPHDALCLSVRGHIMAFVERNPPGALDFFEQAIAQDENSPLAWGLSGVCHAYLGAGDEARERLRNVWRLSPFDPLNFFFWTAAGIGEFVEGRYEEAVAWLRKSYRAKPNLVATLRIFAAALGQNGDHDEASAIGGELLKAEPGFSISNFLAWYPLQRPEDRRRLAEGLKRAGLPK